VSLEAMRKVCAKLEDVTERPHFGSTMFYTGKSGFASCDGDVVVVGLEPDHFETLIGKDPRFTAYPRAKHAAQFSTSKVKGKELEALVRESYELVRAKKKAKRKR